MNLVDIVTNSFYICMIFLIRIIFKRELKRKSMMLFWGIILVRICIPYPRLFRVYVIDSLLRLSDIFRWVRYAFDDTIIIKFKVIYSNFFILKFYIKQGILYKIDILNTIWKIGVLIGVVFVFYRYREQMMILEEALPVKSRYIECWKNNHKKINYSIKYSDRVFQPLSCGFIWDRKIILPKKICNMDSESLNMILTHEWVHVKNYDVLKKLLLTIALIINWYNPVVWMMYGYFVEDLEVCCDEEVIHVLGEEYRLRYVKMLLDLEMLKCRFTVVGIAFGQNFIRRRIENIMFNSRTKLTTLIIVVAFMMTSVVYAFSGVDFRGGYRSVNERFSAEEVKNYEIYSKYGLLYDSEIGRFMYKGKVVRFFSDQLDKDGNLRSFSFSTGEIDVAVVRDENFNILSLKEEDKKVFDDRSRRIENAVYGAFPVENSGNASKEIEYSSDNEAIKKGESFVSKQFEENVDKSYFEDGSNKNEKSEDTIEKNEDASVFSAEQMEKYKEFGVILDEKNNIWRFNGKAVKVLLDGEEFSYVDYDAEGGVSVVVRRNESGKIVGIDLIGEEPSVPGR